jgi:tryptophan synthase alpha chain
MATETDPNLTATEYADRTSVYDTLRDIFTEYGLESLIPTIKKLAMEGAGSKTISFALRDTEEYKQRFIGNEDRIKSGLPVLKPAEYLAVESGYRQTLRSYGLTQFDNPNYVRQFIANDVSPTELSNRASAAVKRVQSADPNVMNTLTKYYGIQQSDLIGYVLDPKQQYVSIERKINAAEIGAQAARQGLQSSLQTSEELAAQGVSSDVARQGYGDIANILPTAEKLSSIYGNTLAGYGQKEAEQEIFSGSASSQRKRHGMTYDGLLDILRAVRAGTDKPMVLYCYYNLLFSFGVENYCRKVREAGCDGLLVLDCPPEEAGDLIAASKLHGLANIFIVAPTTPSARIGLIAKHATGFIYYVSREGVTGERSELATNLTSAVAEIRKHTALPICVGFGVSTAAHVQAIAKVADGVVVGSALVNVVAAHKDKKGEAAAAIGAKVRELLAK